jgi:hypothetical protein
VLRFREKPKVVTSSQYRKIVTVGLRLGFCNERLDAISVNYCQSNAGFIVQFAGRDFERDLLKGPSRSPAVSDT